MNSGIEREALSQRLFALLSEVTDGSLDGDRIAANAEFTDTGMSSIEYLALVEKIETTFDVVIDLEDGSLTSVDNFLDLLVAQGASA
ncbi:MAG TPA: acyl carrier protein [Actinocrinis sp.]